MFLKTQDKSHILSIYFRCRVCVGTFYRSHLQGQNARAYAMPIERASWFCIFQSIRNKDQFDLLSGRRDLCTA